MKILNCYYLLQPADSSLSNRMDGEINKANKNNKTTSDQYVNKIVDLLEELDQDYSSSVVEGTVSVIEDTLPKL